MRDYILAVCRAEGFGQIVGPGKGDVVFRFREGKCLLVRELRFVGEDGGHGLSEFRADLFIIFFVCDFDKTVDSRPVHQVGVGVSVVSRAALRGFDVGEPFLPLRLFAVSEHTV